MTRLPLLPDREERISATTYSVTVTRSACAFRVSVTACVNAGARNYSTVAACVGLGRWCACWRRFRWTLKNLVADGSPGSHDYQLSMVEVEVGPAQPG